MAWVEIYNIGAATPAANPREVLLTTVIFFGPICLITGLFVPRARAFAAAVFIIAMVGEGGSAFWNRSAAARGQADLAAGRFHYTEEMVREVRNERLDGRKFPRTTFTVQQVWFELPEPVREACAPRMGDVIRLKYNLIGERVGARIFASILSMATHASECGIR